MRFEILFVDNSLAYSVRTILCFSLSINIYENIQWYSDEILKALYESVNFWLQLAELFFRITRSFHNKRLLANCVVVRWQRKVWYIYERGEITLMSLFGWDHSQNPQLATVFELKPDMCFRFLLFFHALLQSFAPS